MVGRERAQPRPWTSLGPGGSNPQRSLTRSSHTSRPGDGLGVQQQGAEMNTGQEEQLMPQH